MPRNPVLEELQRIQERVDALFDRARPLGDVDNPLSGLGATAASFVPTVDLSETPHAFEVAVELPGMSLDAIHLEVVGRTIVISGDRKAGGEEGGTYRSMERAFGPFRRTLDVQSAIDPEGIQTRYERGVFFATLRKQAGRPAASRKKGRG